MAGQGSREVCLHFLNGMCHFGADCARSHDPSALRPLCIYFERGSCNRGSSCLYAHGPDDRQPKLAPAGAAGGRGRGGRGSAGHGRGRQPGRGGARGGGRGRGRQGAAQRQPQPPPAEHSLQVYRDATERELEMLDEWEEEEEARLFCEAHDRLRLKVQSEGVASGEAAAEAAEATAEDVGEHGSQGKADEAAEAAGGKAASAGAGSGSDGGSDSEAEAAEEGAAAAGGRAAAVTGAAAAAKRELPALCSERYGQVVTPPFLPTNWCAPCRRSFTTPSGLLSHLKATHKQDSERIAALESLRRCPCGRDFEAFNQLSSHIRNVHCKPTAMQREGAAIGDALFRMAMICSLGGGFGSSDDDDYGFGGGGYGPFSGADVEELLCQGVKPWDDDAADVLAVLNDDYDDFY